MGVYVCDACNKRLYWRKSLVRHSWDHLSDQPPLCEPCNKVFITQSCLISHISSSHTNTGLFKCDCCMKDFKGIKYLAQHYVLEHQRNRPMVGCEICGKKFRCLRHLRGHKQQVHFRKGMAQCDVCGKNAVTKHDLKNHIADFHQISACADGSYICDPCDKRFLTKSILNKHVRVTHTHVSQLICDHCSLAFPIKEHLGIHYGIKHRKRQLFECDLCHQSVFNLRLHEKYNHRGTKFGCDQCGKVFGRKLSMKIHILSVHLNQKSYHCSLCEAKFSTSVLRWNHTRQSHWQKPFYCDDCGRAFRARQHMVIHKCEKHLTKLLLECLHCPATFVKASSLANHCANKHSFSEINSSFSGRMDQKEHPICDHCQGVFKTKHSLKLHLSTVHSRKLKSNVSTKMI